MSGAGNTGGSSHNNPSNGTHGSGNHPGSSVDARVQSAQYFLKEQPISDESTSDPIYDIARVLQYLVSIVLIGISGNMLSDPNSLMRSQDGSQAVSDDSAILANEIASQLANNGSHSNILNLVVTSLQLLVQTVVMLINVYRKFKKAYHPIDAGGLLRVDTIQASTVAVSDLSQIGLYAGSFFDQVLRFGSRDCSNAADLLDLYNLTMSVDDMSLLSFYGIYGSNFFNSTYQSVESVNMSYISAQTNSLLSMSSDCGLRKGSLALNFIALVCFLFTGKQLVTSGINFHQSMETPKNNFGLYLDFSDNVTSGKPEKKGKLNVVVVTDTSSPEPRILKKVPKEPLKDLIVFSYETRFSILVGMPRLKERAFVAIPLQREQGLQTISTSPESTLEGIVSKLVQRGLQILKRLLPNILPVTMQMTRQNIQPQSQTASSPMLAELPSRTSYETYMLNKRISKARGTIRLSPLQL